MNQFASKIDTWLAVLIGGAIIVPIGFGLYLLNTSLSASLTAIGAGLFTALLVGLLAVPCRYTLHDDYLLIRSGLIRQKILYSDIERIEPSSNPLSAPALSLRRVLITYRGGFQLISPLGRDEFIRLLRERVAAVRAAPPADGNIV